jgi:hypothetical protein
MGERAELEILCKERRVDPPSILERREVIAEHM